MAENITNPEIITAPLGETFEEQNLPLQRTVLLDFFPNVCVQFPGYIRHATFADKMTRIIRETVEAKGPFTNLYWFEPDYNEGWDKNRIDKQRQREREDYLQDLKDSFLFFIAREDWWVINEHHSSDQLFMEAEAYYKSAGIDMAFVIVGKGIGTIGKKVFKHGSKIVKKGSAHIETSTINGRVYNKSVNLGVNTKYGRVPVAEFDALDFTTDQLKEGFKNGEQAISGNPYEGFNPFDLHFQSKPAQVTNKVFDTFTDFVPVVSNIKGIFTIGANLLLGHQVKTIAEQAKAMEDQSNDLIRKLNEKIKQVIFNDMRRLKLPEMEELIEICGMKELIQ